MIEIVPHNSEWIEIFNGIKNNLWPKLERFALSIEHVGSTSVPGLHAKPVVDIAIIVESKQASDQAVKILESLGYQHRGDLGIKDREAFKRPDNSPRHNLYVALKDSLSLRNHLALKKLMIERQDLRDKYAALKMELAAKCGTDIDRYCDLKTEFIIECLEQCEFTFSELNEIRKANNIPELEVSIEAAHLDEVTEISNLMQSIFGPNPKCAETFTKWINGSIYHVNTAKVGSKIVGVASSWISIEPNLAKYEPYGSEAINFLKDQKLGWFLTLAILPTYRKSKIGWKLAQGHRDWLKSQGCTSLIGSSWVTGSTDNSSHMFVKSGFQKLGESNALLRADLQATGATCGACKKNECECSAVLYGLRL